MSFPRYPAYKPSGVEWLGEVPEHWDVKRVRRIFEIKKRIAGELGFDVLSITQQGIKTRDPESNDGQISMDYSKYQMVEPGDFAMNHMDLLTGFVDISSRTGVTSPDYRVFSVSDPGGSDARYLLYVFQMGYRQKILYAYGQGSSQLGRWRLPTDGFLNWAIPFPSRDEQRSIALFLDRETAKIDALIAEQQRLIELLQEKRQAVISHAVTKGLNPNAPMKDSGVEWLGEVPEHWAVTPIKHVCKIGNGSTPNKENPAYWQGGHFPWLTSTSVNDDQVATANAYVTEQALLECSLPIVEPPAVLVGITGQGKTRGMAATLRITCTINQHLAFLKPHSDSTRIDFLRSAIDNLYAYFRRDTDGAGSTKGAITCSQLGLYKVAVPPPTEQEEIEASIGLTQSAMSKLMKDAERNVELLQERRSALISAAVTGQIDVRGLMTNEETA